MASNDGTILDGNGASSDWIEIYNSGDQSVDLADYSLTDDPGDLNKWDFPSTIIDPGEYLVVYASGNNTPDLAGNLHTNFSLSASGDYLALVDQGGVVLSEFGVGGANYPAQTADVSHGLAFVTDDPNPVTPSSSVSYFAPDDDSVDGFWMTPGFNDAGWSTGVASLGYNYGSLTNPEVTPPDTSLYVRIPFTITNVNATLTTLQMKYDDGFIAYINGVVVASANDPVDPAWNTPATAEHFDADALVYEDFDISASSNLLQVGTNILAIHALNRNAASPGLLMVPNLLVTNNGGLITPHVVGQLESPTPGTPNTNVLASDVAFSRVGGVFTDSFQLTMSSDDPAEEIRYTTDGSLPQANSLLYTGPITVSSTTQFRARAYGSIGQAGASITESYTLTSASLSNFTSDLPIVVLENFEQGIPGSEFQDASFALYETDEITGRSSLSNPADLTSRIGQHRRGSSTFNNLKFNLRIEMRDELDEDKNISLLGMPAESDWILYAPYRFDRAMIRNTLLYDLSNQMGNYAVRTRFVEVYSNSHNGVLNENDYMGVYVLMENIKIDSNRVDLDKLNPDQNSEPDISGGYIIKIDRDDPNVFDDDWHTNRNIPTPALSKLVHVTPERNDITLAQRDYIRGYVQDFEDALYGPDSTDPDLGYQAYFDVDASIDHHLIRILSKEPDSLRLSTYLTKERNGKLSFGPIWDSDRSMGPDNDNRAADPIGWNVPDSDAADFFEFDWWGELFDDPNFTQRWVDRWQKLREGVLSDANIFATIGGQAAEIAEAQVRNFSRWWITRPNGGSYADAGLTGWEAEVSHLSNWLITRAQWMDDQMHKAPTLGPTPGNVPLNTAIAITSNEPGAAIYYTLDGSDPRADGGGISPNAILYSGTIIASQTTHVNARAVQGGESSNSNYPGDKTPTDALDGNSSTKYLNYGKGGSGIIITPDSGSSIVRSFQVTTANNFEARDPASIKIYGTNESILSLDNSDGSVEDWQLIASGILNLPSSRGSVASLVQFPNSDAYTSYKVIFPTVKDPGLADSMQIADIQFYPSPTQTNLPILSANDGALAVHDPGNTPASTKIGHWSQLISGLYSVELPASASNLRITEVHYHPTNPTAAELVVAPGTDDDDFEFIELANTSGNTISLNGVQFTDGVTFDFTTGSITSLTPGEVVLVVKDQAAFETRYGTGLPIAGEFSGKLSNGGEQIILVDNTNQTIHDFTYNDATPWPTAADGEGPSMTVVDAFGDHSVASNWQASAIDSGTPGDHVLLHGDYDRNGIVNQLDYDYWASRFGETIFPAGGADGNSNGIIDVADYTVWRDNLGSSLSVMTSPALASEAEQEQPTNAVESDVQSSEFKQNTPAYRPIFASTFLFESHQDNRASSGLASHNVGDHTNSNIEQSFLNLLLDVDGIPVESRDDLTLDAAFVTFDESDAIDESEEGPFDILFLREGRVKT